MSPEESEVYAAAVFAPEAREYWRQIAFASDLNLAHHQLEDEADRAQRRSEGEHWARTFGRGCTLDIADTSELWELVLYSPDVDVRVRAADLVVAALRDERRAA